jgi:hypothetical protein
MLIKQNLELYEEFADFINAPPVRDALHVLIGAASNATNFECYPENKGEIKDFRYYIDEDKQPFAFIINKNSLLFYLRHPAIESNKYDFGKLINWFGEVNENNKGEWTIRVNNRNDAILINEKIILYW